MSSNARFAPKVPLSDVAFKGEGWTNRALVMPARKTTDDPSRQGAELGNVFTHTLCAAKSSAATDQPTPDTYLPGL